LPANQRKVEVVEQLEALAEEAGIALPHLAVAFVIRHPGVTSALIGPRTMEQLTSLLPAAEIVLSDDVLDRIDQIVPPGVTVNEADAGWLDAEDLADPAKRRRPAGT
jgi:aryl-alcohol dehydrogenase-like predicted oxidoreductase